MSTSNASPAGAVPPEARPDVLIVGGGIIGLFAARELIRAGATVSVVERDRQARHASWAGAGILTPMMPWEVSTEATALSENSAASYRGACAEMEAATGLDAGFRDGCMLIFPPWSPALELWLQESKAPHERLSAAAVGELLGPLAPQREAVMLADSGTVRPPRLCRALLQWLKLQPGFRLHRGAAALSPTALASAAPPGGQVEGVEAGGNLLLAGDYVLAAGPWSAELVPWAGLEIEPVRGQIVAYETGQELPPMTLVVGEAYAVVRPDGVVLVGSTRERVGFAAEPTAAGKALLMDKAARILPALADREPEHHWAGLRPGAARPLIGKLEPVDNLWISAGHSRDGFSCAPRSAELLTALLLGRQPPCDPAPLAPPRR